MRESGRQTCYRVLARNCPLPLVLGSAHYPWNMVKDNVKYQLEGCVRYFSAGRFANKVNMVFYMLDTAAPMII